MSKRFRKIIGNVLFGIVIVVILFYLAFPFYWAISSSLKTETQLQMTPATLIPLHPIVKSFFPTLNNYKAILSNPRFIQGFINSLITAVCTTGISLLLGSFAGFAIGKLRFRGKTASMYAILAMTMFPQVTVLSGLYAAITQLQLSAIPGMILSYLIFTLPFTAWVLSAFFRELPSSLMQAAEVDGATPFQTFYKILLPLASPALVTTGLLSFIAAWNEYLFALTFTSIEPSARTVPVVISLFTGEVMRQEPFGEIMAGTVLVTLPLIVLVLIFQNRIIDGLTAGAVKG